MPPVKNNFQRGWRIFMPELSPPSDPIARRGASTTTRDRLAQPARHRISLLGVLLLISALMMLDMARASGADPEFDFDVPPSPASKALVLFARQANIQLLFPYEAVSTVQLKGISGRYTAKDGIEALIAGTCLEATLSTETDTTLKISRQTRGFWFMRNDNCKPRKHKKVLSSILAAGIGVSAGMAHGAEPVQPAVLDEIIVTAQKREERLQNVPISVTALSAERLNKSLITEFNDLSKATSGVTLSASKGGFFPTVRVRGVGSNRFTPSIAASVGIFLDDVPYTRLDAAFSNLLDLDSVEILKGPQSTLFGKDVSSGAIALRSKRPNFERVSGTLRMQIDNNGLREYGAVANLPLGDTLAARGSIYTTEDENEIRNLATHERPSNESKGGRVQLRWNPVDSLDIVVSHQRNENEAHNGINNVIEYGTFSRQIAAAKGVNLPRAGSERKAYFEIPARRIQDTEISALHVRWNLRERWSFTSISSYQEWELDTPETTSASAPMATLGSMGKQGFHGWTEELRLSYQSDALSSLIGVFLSKGDRYNTTDVYQAVAVGPGGA